MRQVKATPPSRSSPFSVHLSVDLLGEGGARLGGGVHRRTGSGLHGDQLHLVGLPSGAVRRTTREAVNVVKDGGRGQELVWTVAWRNNCRMGSEVRGQRELNTPQKVKKEPPAGAVTGRTGPVRPLIYLVHGGEG